MDPMFEEDNDEVGADIEAYCPKCKGDTSHTVITKYEDEIRRVQCSPCGDVHAYRKPRGEVEDEIPEPVAAKKRAAAKKPTWQEAMDKAGNKGIANARAYSIRDHYKEGDIVTHPKFGIGFVTEIFEMKVEVTFNDERRVLVHNRPDLAAQMPAIASIPLPRDEKGRGKKGQKGGQKPGQKVVAAVSPPPAPPVAKGKEAKGAAKGKPALPPPAAKLALPAKPAVAGKSLPPVAATKSGKPVVAAKPGQAERAKAVASKKGAAIAAKTKTAAKPAARPTPSPAKASKPARPAARTAQVHHAAVKGKKHAKKAR